MKIEKNERDEKDIKRSRQRCRIDGIYYNLPVMLFDKIVKLNNLPEAASRNAVLGEVTYRYIAVFVDGEYKQMVYVEASSGEKAEAKLKKEGWEGWIRLTEITDDLQVIFDGR